MVEKQIIIPKSEAKKKIQSQFTKGDELWRTGSILIESHSPNRVPTQERDIFETNFKHWVKLTSATLSEIFLSASYADEFESSRSSEKDPVYSQGKDIRYFIDHLIRPKLSYLHMLTKSIYEYEEIEHKEEPDASQPFTENNLELPPKVTLAWLWKNVPYRFWLTLVGLLVGAFLFGISAGQIEWIKKLFGN